MSIRAIFSHAQRHHSVRSLTSTCQGVITKRQITTSQSRPFASTATVQSSFATALSPEDVEPVSYPFHYTPQGPKKWSPAAQRIAQGLPIKKQTAGTSEKVEEELEYDTRSNAEDLYWQKIPLWSDVTLEDFIRYTWQMGNTIQRKDNLLRFLDAVLPDFIPPDRKDLSKQTEAIKTRKDFIKDVEEGMELAPMSVRLTPHVLSVIDWSNPIPDPVRRQFIPMKSTFIPDHSKLELDSLHESDDSPVPGLVHRYPDKALFLGGFGTFREPWLVTNGSVSATSVCPVYCRFCTRSYSVGQDTPSNTKTSFKPTPNRWEKMFSYIERTPSLTDIVVSGGDSYLLPPHHLILIGERLLSIPHIRRFRFATKGLAVCPGRILDGNDTWTDALISISNKGKKLGKAVAVHTHFNHPNEITWLTRLATQKLFENGVVVRNQSVLLRGVNDDVEVMKTLIRDMADINVIPYYVYQGDMVRGVEELRTPLQTILDMETQIRGSIAGFLTPQFVVDLPGGGGKRLAASKLSYDRRTGLSTFVAPAVGRKKGEGEDRVFEYYDPLWSLQL